MYARDTDLDFAKSIDDLSYHSCIMKRLSRGIILIAHTLPDASISIPRRPIDMGLFKIGLARCHY